MLPEPKFVNIEKPVQQASVAQAQYLSTVQAAAYLGVSRQTPEIGRHKGTGPIYCRPEIAAVLRPGAPAKAQPDGSVRILTSMVAGEQNQAAGSREFGHVR